MMNLHRTLLLASLSLATAAGGAGASPAVAVPDGCAANPECLVEGVLGGVAEPRRDRGHARRAHRCGYRHRTSGRTGRTMGISGIDGSRTPRPFRLLTRLTPGCSGQSSAGGKPVDPYQYVRQP